MPTYVENVFSTYLYAGVGGSGPTLTVNNGIDLSTYGGMTWQKVRDDVNNNVLVDTVRGSSYGLFSNTTGSQTSSGLSSFNTNGFTLNGNGTTNYSGYNFASWTFRKQPKFFDIVTYTGTGSAQNISHNLGSVPGCIIVKYISAGGNWGVYHQGLNGGTNPQNYFLNLNTTAAQVALSSYWNNTAPTSTQFTVGNSGITNQNGGTYIAYLFATSGTGGFGLTGTQDIISCGSFTTDGSGNASVNIGWEPQWVLLKQSDGASNWKLYDTMRGMVAVGSNGVYLLPNSSAAESAAGTPHPTATGFNIDNNTASANFIYIAIRRGPMAVPTTGTSVFSPSGPVDTTTGHPNLITTNFPVDLSISCVVSGSTSNKVDFDRLRGNSVDLSTNTTAAESSGDGPQVFDNNTAIGNNYWGWNPVTFWNFARAPGFFDVVCYTGNGATSQNINHNLTVVPQLMIVKRRSGSVASWFDYCAFLNGGVTPEQWYLIGNASDAQATGVTGIWNNTAPTSTVFTVGNNGNVNLSGGTFVAYLFASVTGVSKVGSYTGTGGTQSIACGFGSGGARFILAKRIDSTGDWYCWDSANGLTSGSSPYLLWDSTAAQTTGNNGTYASSGGFTLTSASPVNTSGGTFIFLAIA